MPRIMVPVVMCRECENRGDKKFCPFPVISMDREKNFFCGYGVHRAESSDDREVIDTDDSNDDPNDREDVVKCEECIHRFSCNRGTWFLNSPRELTFCSRGERDERVGRSKGLEER